MSRLSAHITRFVITKMLIVLGVQIMCVACSNDMTMEELLSQYKDMDLTSKTDKIEGLGRLRVLAIGNSYTIDGTVYIKNVMSEIGEVNDEDYCVYVMVMAGAALDDWSRVCQDNEISTISLVAGDWKMPVTQGTMEELFAQDWDVIVFQQVSLKADNYFSYNPALGVLTELARRCCTNKDMIFAWHLIHSYANSYDTKLTKGEERWNGISLAAQCVMAQDGFDLLIPMGTAIQNARGTLLNTENDLTRDGTHLAYGVGRYVAACAWVQALFAPAFSFSILDHMDVYGTREVEMDGDYKNTDTYVSVTEDNRIICRQCAYLACLFPYRLQ